MNARIALVLLAAVALAGCSTKRILTIDSAPDAARVWVNGEDRGQTPVDHVFVHYGVTHVRLEKEGYESLSEDVEISPAIDGYPVIDLPFEILVPERRFRWTGRMRPLTGEVTEESIQEDIRRAETFRERARREAGEP
ncbi:MAG: PEGA domain-containing protein [Planctomycetota bacterium]|jgi:hypothetical protein